VVTLKVRFYRKALLLKLTLFSHSGFMNAGSELKYLRFATGRHDLPFYTKEGVVLQKSFLDAFLKGNDPVGWSTGQAPRVELIIREGNPGVNDPEAEKAFPTRIETTWPIPRTVYTKYHLGPDHTLAEERPSTTAAIGLSYQAPSGLKEQHKLQFLTKPFDRSVEVTGHIVAHLNVSASAFDATSTPPSEIDLFITLRHLAANGQEVFYTGADGDAVPVCKGWLRVSLRKVNDKSSRHTSWHPHREYRSVDQLPVVPGEIYGVDVELWPTSVVISPRETLVFEVSSGDTQGAGRFEHNSPVDRPVEKFHGLNHIHFGEGLENYVLLPVIPKEDGATK
jgi:predicted acyl esterase